MAINLERLGEDISRAGEALLLLQRLTFRASVEQGRIVVTFTPPDSLNAEDVYQQMQRVAGLAKDSGVSDAVMD